MSNQLTLQEVANQLNVSEKSIRRYIKSGRIKAGLVKGQKGNEYRIDIEQIKKFQKPPRGKNSHSTVAIKKPLRKEKEILVKKSPAKQIEYPKEQFSHAGSIAQQKINQIAAMSQNQESSIDYKILYERLLAKYEQTLIMIGSLEAQLQQNKPKQIEQNNIGPSLDTVQRQEDLIMELYQIIDLYKNHQE